MENSPISHILRIFGIWAIPEQDREPLHVRFSVLWGFKFEIMRATWHDGVGVLLQALKLDSARCVVDIKIPVIVLFLKCNYHCFSIDFYFAIHP